MTLEEFFSLVSAEEAVQSIQILLPDGQALPPHFHLTEIGKVSKDFVDCGGTRRTKTSCVLQTWVAEDVEHRLSREKLSAILAKSKDLGLEPATEIEFEVQLSTLSMFVLTQARVTGGRLELQLGSLQTQCLAPDRCGVPSLQVIGEDCTGPGCC